MANRLKMATVDSILRLHAQRWSQRRIAAELHVDRKTVSRYVHLADRDAKRANAPTGSDALAPGGALAPPPDSKRANAPPGSMNGSVPEAVVNFLAQPGGRGRRSDCEPYRDLILAKLDQGLTARRIYQDLTADHGFTARYWSVRRFVGRLSGGTEFPMRRMEVGPGDEAQVDFGAGAPIVSPDGKRRKTNVFRIVLSHSRKAYSEATFTQTAEDFIRCLENAFAHFGGVPRTLVIDNLRAAVAHPDWFDPELNPKLQSFAQHYNLVILPTKPYTPRHKGKIEAGVKYVKNNGLKGHVFPSLEAENQHLFRWEQSTADTRIHGTTKQQVGRVFDEVEQATLQPLPAERFPFFHEAQRKVSRDGHVEVARAYYSVPAEHLGRTVWARWDARLVWVFDQRFRQIALHVRHEQGRFSTHAEHLAPEKISGLEKGAAYLLGKVEHIGPHTHAWAQALLVSRGIEGTRVLLGVLSLSKKQSCESLEKACEIALSHGSFRLRTLRELLKRDAAKQTPLPFLDEHPLIRPLADYGRIVAAALVRQDGARRVGGEGFTRHGWAKEWSGMARSETVKHEKRPGDRSLDHQGAADIPPPRSGYPLSGCSSAEPDSVSPDSSSVVHDSPSRQELSHE
jgi:transposase